MTTMSTAPRTLAELYDVHRLPLTRLATALLGDRADGEDAVHEAFLKLWRRHGDRLDGLDNPDGYLRVAVVNNARSMLRSRRTARERTPHHEVPHAQSAEDIVLPRGQHEVLDAVRALPRRQREVLVLRYWSELSPPEIAAALGVHEGTVKSSTSRGLRNLARMLEGRELG